MQILQLGGEPVIRYLEQNRVEILQQAHIVGCTTTGMIHLFTLTSSTLTESEGRRCQSHLVAFSKQEQFLCFQRYS